MTWGNGLGEPQFWTLGTRLPSLKGPWLSVPRPLNSKSVTHLTYPMLFLHLVSFLLTLSNGMIVF